MPAMVPPVADERDGLLRYLEQQRVWLRAAAHGLTEEQARATPSASALSVGGLVKHVAAMERTWMGVVRRSPVEVDYDDSFQLGADETLAEVLADYVRAADETTQTVADFDLGYPVPVPDAPWFPGDVAEWSVRWVLLHLIQETARHAGHADIVRESVDGATAFPLLAAVEGWPVTPWLRPWEPAAAVR